MQKVLRRMQIVAIIMAKFFQVLPNPLLTEDQIKLLENNNIILNTDYTFKYLDINPVSLELILPDYLKRFKMVSSNNTQCNKSIHP